MTYTLRQKDMLLVAPVKLGR